MRGKNLDFEFAGRYNDFNPEEIMPLKPDRQLTRILPLIAFQPPLLCWNPHSQTILGEVLPSRGLISRGEKMLVHFPGGDQVVCRLFRRESPTLVVLFHGLAGSTNSKYMQRVARELLKAGYSVCMMNHRNAGEGKGLAREIYHCGRSDDLGYVIAELRRQFPTKRIVALGFSLSASALLLLMSGVVPMKGIYEKEQFLRAQSELGIALPDLAIAVNPPIDLARTTRNFEYLTNRPYAVYFLSYLEAAIRDLNKDNVFHKKPPPISWFMSIKEFDHQFTAPQAGFESSQDYYRKCSAKDHLHKIDESTIILTSSDDPFIDVNDFYEAKMSSHVRLHVEEAGGHLGYIHRENTPLGSYRWLDYAIVETLKL
jgi:uncharacterized protein